MPLMSKLAVVALLAAGVQARTEEKRERRPLGVGFVGKAPKFKVYPGGEEAGSTWLMIEFGKIQEVGPAGRMIPSHSINSLAAENMQFTEEDTTMYGVDVKQVTMSLNLPFDESDCRAPGGGGGGPNNDNGNRPARRLGQGSITVKTFIFANDTEVPYDDYLVPMEAGQLKFNLESADWPFCSPENSLTVDMAVKIPSEEKGTRPRKTTKMEKRADKPEDKEMRRPRPQSKEFKADAGGNAGVTMDLPELAILDGVASAATVALEDRGGKTVIKFTFPAFNSTMLYDPSVTFDEDEATSIVTSGGARAAAWAPLVLALGAWLWQ